mmetsp:Transcript_11803/g.19605  ORF Transcript_11803/g.19605 Transcript_11803/m.19605 type:complete len:155 (+) Transcript_11803:81-545(+)
MYLFASHKFLSSLNNKRATTPQITTTNNTMPVFSLIDVNVNVVDGTTPALTTKKEKNATATASIDDISPTKRKKIAQDSAQLFGETSSPARPAKKSKNHIVADSSGSDSDDDSAEELDGYRRLLGIFERELTGALIRARPASSLPLLQHMLLED